MTKKIKILVAEDETDIRELIAFTLKNIGGYEVVKASNGADAVAKVEELLAGGDRLPDLILMDVRMPKMTGYDACAKLKEKDETRPIPVVFLSAKGQEQEIETGLKVGAVDYILKPFAPDDLIKSVDKILREQGIR